MPPIARKCGGVVQRRTRSRGVYLRLMREERITGLIYAPSYRLSTRGTSTFRRLVDRAGRTASTAVIGNAGAADRLVGHLDHGHSHLPAYRQHLLDCDRTSRRLSLGDDLRRLEARRCRRPSRAAAEYNRQLGEQQPDATVVSTG